LKIEFSKKFIKDIEKINDQNLIKKVIEIIEKLKKNEKIEMKKIKGFKNFYRIRIGNYRLGIEKNDNVIIIKRFLHRKQIYQFFP